MAGSLLHAALWYADLGYAVFPCSPERKTPLSEHGLLDATTDPERIERWWTEHPNANVAIRTDGLMVIDIDGADNQWLLGEPDKLRDLATAPTSLTPRGGRHHIFRQPVGKTWRNTASRIAAHVDTRANGGYICVAPSAVGGNTYRWVDAELLCVSPERLPEPPPWLVELVSELTTPSPATPMSDGNPIREGQRNATLARLAGAMRRMGMSATEILAALERINQERCQPPLDGPEVERVAASIARYAPDSVSVALVEDHYEQDRAEPKSQQPQRVRDLLSRHPMLRAPVIMGLLRRGETMNVIAPPKTGKSWLVLSLAMAVATGRPWLGAFDTTPGNVLIIDNELHAETLAHRIPQVAEALDIGLDEIGERIAVQSLRGQLQDIFSMCDYFKTLEVGRFAMVVLDAFYRFMPQGSDENDNGTMANIYNRIDAFADRLGCSFVLIHHTTKGGQAGKSVTDVGAGAGSQSRATDTHLVMRPHEESDAVVLDAAVRSWAPIEPLALRWEFPAWTPAPDLDPTALRSERPRKSRREKASEPEWDAERFAQTFVTADPAAKSELLDRATAAGLSERRAVRLLQAAESRGLVHRWISGPRSFAMFSTQPQPQGGRP